MRWTVFKVVCLVLLGIITFDENRRHELSSKILNELHTKWVDSSVESR